MLLFIGSWISFVWFKIGSWSLFRLSWIYYIRFRSQAWGGQLGWRLSGPRGFEVCSYYRTLTPLGVENFLWKRIWKPKVPPQVAFFIWTTTLGKILIVDNLRKRHIIVVCWCCMCKVDGESIDHLLLHCHLTRELWDAVLALFGVQWVMLRQVMVLLACWHGYLV